MNCYLDIPTFQAAGMGGPLALFLGGNTVLLGAAVVGATSLTVQSTDGFTPGQTVYILDGPQSEIVYVAPNGTPSPIPNDSTLTLAAGCAFAHAVGVSVSSGSSMGDLGRILLNASGWIEGYCRQGTYNDRSLFATARTETLKMPTSYAYLDEQYGLYLWPKHFPIQSIASCALEAAVGISFAVDITQGILDTRARSVAFPLVQALTGTLNPFLSGPPLMRGDNAFAVLTYTGGLTYGALPGEFVYAACLVAQETLMHHENPLGSALLIQGDVRNEQRLRGSGGKETSTDTIFRATAREILEEYRTLGL